MPAASWPIGRTTTTTRGPIPASAASPPPKPPPRPRRKQGWGMPQPCLPSPPASGIKTTGDSTHNRRKRRSQVTRPKARPDGVRCPRNQPALSYPPPVPLYGKGITKLGPTPVSGGAHLAHRPLSLHAMGDSLTRCPNFRGHLSWPRLRRELACQIAMASRPSAPGQRDRGNARTLPYPPNRCRAKLCPLRNPFNRNNPQDTRILNTQTEPGMTNMTTPIT